MKKERIIHTFILEEEHPPRADCECTKSGNWRLDSDVTAEKIRTNERTMDE
jgi:hypothetical protein